MATRVVAKSQLRIVFVILAIAGCLTTAHNPPIGAERSPDTALKMLQNGNRRFVGGHPLHPNQSAAARERVADGQKPFAVILACADSRVAPEVIFDAGLGDLFVVRVAGNTADDAALGSIEYAVEHLGSPLIVVMGHSQCGAVTAAVDQAASGAKPAGHLGAVIDPITPAVKSQSPGQRLLERAVDQNVRNMVTKISADPELAHLIDHGKVKVVGGRYDLSSGRFQLLE